MEGTAVALIAVEKIGTELGVEGHVEKLVLSTSTVVLMVAQRAEQAKVGVDARLVDVLRLHL
jgi:hypothetical protein